MSESRSLENQVFAALRRISHAIDLHSRVLVQKRGLTVPQLVALRAVGELRRATVGTVARRIHLSPATVTGVLDRLEGRRLVTRSRDGQDRRTVVVELTSAGAELLESSPSLLQERFRRELAKLQQWEQTELLASVQRIATMMDAEGVEGVPVLDTGNLAASCEDASRCLQKAGGPVQEGAGREGPAKQVRGSAAPEVVDREVERVHARPRTLNQEAGRCSKLQTVRRSG